MVKVTSTGPYYGVLILPPSTFIISGQQYEFEELEREGPVEAVRSWEMDHYPKVHATVPLKDGGTVDVYASATHWNRTQISVRWFDDDRNSLKTWLPKENIRRVTDSEWDIDQYNRTPEWLRAIQWGRNFERRLPGFLPE